MYAFDGSILAQVDTPFLYYARMRSRRNRLLKLVEAFGSDEIPDDLKKRLDFCDSWLQSVRGRGFPTDFDKEAARSELEIKMSTGSQAHEPDQFDSVIDDILEDYRLKTRKARAAEHAWRIKNEFASGHPFVIMNTLTWRHEDSADKSHYRNYRERVDRLLYSVGVRKEDHKIYCVPEYGETRGRLHLHVLHILHVSRLPWSLDKFGQVEEIKKCWRYGISKPFAIRFGKDDAWSRIGHPCPIDVLPNAAERVASYVSHYVVKKGSVICQTKKKSWRTSMTRGLGLKPLLNGLKMFPPKDLLKITREDLRRMKDVPSMLVLKQIAKLNASRLRRHFMDVPPLESLPKRLRDMIKGRQNTSGLNSGTIEIQKLREVTRYSFDLSQTLAFNLGVHHDSL